MKNDRADILIIEMHDGASSPQVASAGDIPPRLLQSPPHKIGVVIGTKHVSFRQRTEDLNKKLQVKLCLTLLGVTPYRVLDFLKLTAMLLISPKQKSKI
jgi:hypothetical protein